MSGLPFQLWPNLTGASHVEVQLVARSGHPLGPHTHLLGSLDDPPSVSLIARHATKSRATWPDRGSGGKCAVSELTEAAAGRNRPGLRRTAIFAAEPTINQSVFSLWLLPDCGLGRPSSHLPLEGPNRPHRPYWPASGCRGRMLIGQPWRAACSRCGV